MLYKPKYCCNCGDRIDRTQWRLRSSRRFCQVCETDHVLDEWIPVAVLVSSIGFGLLGLGGFFEDTAQAVPVGGTFKRGSSQPAKTGPPSLRIDEASNRESTPDGVQGINTPSDPERRSERFACGAVTKKGSACSRRVDSRGARCWQHR